MCDCSMPGRILVPMSMQYTKMSGAGNTFIMTDGRALPPDADLAAMARHVCDPAHESGGADGFIAVYPGQPGDDFEMRYYNRDGSSGMMCGNGGRCAVSFARDIGLAPNAAVRFSNAGARYRAEFTPRGVRVYFPDPRRFDFNRELDVFGALHIYHYADVGTPHAVMFVGDLGIESLDALDIDRWGSAVRNHPAFESEGANANFVAVMDDLSGIRLRTFERGVEAETGACGTGAISSAIIAAMLHELTPPIAVVTTSGATLWVDFTITETDVTKVSLEGGAEVIQNSKGEIQKV